MRTVLLINHMFLIFAILQSSSPVRASSTIPEESRLEAPPSSPKLTVSLKSASDVTILFKSENVTVDDGERIPHLVLTRNGVLTPAFERTLMISVGNLGIPKHGLYARLIIETQHNDPDLERKASNPIRVWDDTRFIPYSPETGLLTSIDFTVAFQRFFKHQQKAVRTPTDYFGVEIELFDPQGNVLNVIRKEYAFLMENQWRVPLPRVLEETDGAAPSDLVVYFCDMIPFQADLRIPDTRIPRSEIERYIQTQLVPAMTTAFEFQSNVWNLPWYAEWSNYRTDEDPKTLSVALGEHGTWFHGKAPALAHAMISIRVDGSFGEYSDLTDGIMSVFHHELFHNQQRNISQHFGGTGNIAGKGEAWKMFSEGTAVLASVVGQPSIQLEPSGSLRSYLRRANAFIGAQDVFEGSLNKSYKDVPYHTAIYWRFLYESCGGINNGEESPNTGMNVIRNVLETLYKGQVVDIHASTDVAEALPRIIDSALQLTTSCVFQTYEESLTHFARALYMLRLEAGRCSSSSDSSYCGFFDPYHLYEAPHAEDHLIKTDSATYINGAIPSSYGIDLMELTLPGSMAARSLTLTIKNTADFKYEFHAELWKIQTLDDQSHPERWPVQIGKTASVGTQNGSITLKIKDLDAREFDGLALIIIRMDPYEDEGITGRYSIQVMPE